MRGQRCSSWARGSTRQTTMPCVSGGRHAVQNTWSPCGISSSAVGGSSHAPLTSRQGRSFTRSMAQPVCLRDVCAPAKPPDITRGIKTIFIVSLMCSVVVSDSYHFRDKKKRKKEKRKKETYVSQIAMIIMEAKWRASPLPLKVYVTTVSKHGGSPTQPCLN